MNNVGITTESFTAIVINDTAAKNYTIFLDGKSGPVVTAPTLEEAKAKFDEALDLACAVRNLNVFAAAIKEHNVEQKEKLAKKTHTTSKPTIEYRQIETASC